MEKLLYFVAFQVTLSSRAFAISEPTTKACIDNCELSFFCDKKQFYDAKKICEDIGSYLVRVDNANMTEIIGDTLDQMSCPNNMETTVYVGATADINRKWTWLDGSKVYLQSEVGYQNWDIAQPNDFGGNEDCMTLQVYTKTWYDSLCIETGDGRHYICQKDLTLNVKIIELSYDALECSTTSGICVSQVEWRRNNETVSISPNNSVHQNFSSGTSILHYENATINDEGEYTCVTWVLKNEANRVRASKNVRVNRAPEVTNIDSFACNSSLVIFWNAHPRSIGLLHRIKVINSYSGDLIEDIMKTTGETNRQITEIEGLKSATNYNLQISACTDGKTCTDEHTVNRTATTGGIVIHNATMLSDNDTCIVTWNMPYNISAGFKIILTSSTENNASEINTTEVDRYANKSSGDLSYSFKMQPKQLYKVQLQLTGNTNFCLESVNVIGICRGRNISTTTTPEKYCELHVNTCKNGGNCISTPQANPFFECDCTGTGFKGVTCSEELIKLTSNTLDIVGEHLDMEVETKTYDGLLNIVTYKSVDDQQQGKPNGGFRITTFTFAGDEP